jgi:hemoglobin/transferrin/lactoferrin receptor protein
MQMHQKTFGATACALACGLFGSASQAAGDHSTRTTVLVTATRGERSSFDAPQAVNIISRRAMAEANVATTPDALAGVAGVLIQKSNTGGGSPFIRGLTGKQVLILLDGVRVNNSYYRFGPHQYLNTVDPAELSRIEVVHGPGSVLHGSDALGGVINLITPGSRYSPGEARASGLLSLRAASADDSLAGHVQAEYANADISLLAGASLKRYGELRGGAGIGQQVPTGYDEASGSVRLGYRLAANQEVVLRQHVLRQRHVPKSNEVLLGTKAKFDYEPQLNALGYVEYSASELAAGVFDTLKLNLSNNRQKEGEEIIERAAPTIETRELTDVKTLGLTAQFNKRLAGGHRLTYGFDLYRDRYDTSKRRLNLAAGSEAPLVPGTPDGARYTTTGVYAQAEVQLGESLQLIPGLRHAGFKAEGQVQTTPLRLQDSKTTGSLMGLYRLSEQFNLVGSVAQGYRAPNMEDFFGRVDFVSEVPNNALVPETSLNREIGLKFEHRGAAASLHYFVSDYEDLITRVTIGPGVRQRQNLRRARIDGFEASGSLRFAGPWLARAALASVRGEDRDTGLPLQRIPPLNGSLHLRYDGGAGWWLELGSVFADRQDRLSPEDLGDARIPAGGTRGYAIFNLGAGLRLAPAHELNLRFENLGNTAYKTHGSGIYGPGSQVIASYTLRL